MRRILLDTHVVIWWLTDHPKLGEKARRLIENPFNQIFVSSVTPWEIAIKMNKGLLDLPEEIFDVIDEEDFKPLAISPFHAKQAGFLPPFHQDPFDRMLIAQAQSEALELMTADQHIPKYAVKTIKADA